MRDRPSFDDAALLDAVRGIRWPARRLVPAGAHGAHRSRRRGTAAEFTEYRPYAQGDDPRRLDWKLLARSDRAFVRLTDDHALYATVFALDGSASMAFPLETSGKWHHARRLAVALASVAHGNGDPVGLCLALNAPDTNGVGLNDRDSRRGLGLGARVVVPPRTRTGVVHEIAAALDRATPGSGVARSAPTALSALLSSIVTGARASRVVLISDLLTDAADAAAAIAAARTIVTGGGECYAIHVVATEELAPPSRDTLVEDPEDPTVRRPLIGGARAAYDREFAAWRALVARDWRAAGATYVMTTTDERPEHAVRRIVASQP